MNGFPAVHGAPHQFSLTAPAALTIKPDTSGVFQVYNSGSKPLAVRESLGRYTVNAIRYPAASHATVTAFSSPWVRVSPAAFTLAPGKSETVRISDHVPAGTKGDHWLNVVWDARLASAAPGNLHVAGAVATTVRINEPGTAVAVTSHGLAPAPAVHAGGPDGLLVLWAVIGAVALAVLAAVALRSARRLRRQQAA
jgi:hypothetical protein